MLLSCGSFEGFFRRVQGQTRESYLAGYRNDWSWYYALGLLKNGLKPTLYVPALHEHGKYDTDAGVSVRFLKLSAWYRPFETVLVKRLSRRTRWTLYAEELINAIAFRKTLLEALADDGIDVLYVQEYWSARFDYLVRRLDLPVAGADHGGVSAGVFKLFKAGSFAKAAICYAQTTSEYATIAKFGGRHKLQPNGCDVTQFSPDPTVRRTTSVLSVARLTNRQKRTTDLIRAMTHLPEEWTLDIVGTGPDRDMLEVLVSDLNLQDRIRFHGFVSRSGVRDLLRRCGVYVMPSSNEAVAIAALEAMACGAAVVLSRIRAFEELVTDGANGLLVPVGDVPALASGIMKAWAHRDVLGKAACDTVRTRYNSSILYRDLAESLVQAVTTIGDKQGRQAHSDT
jgi:glycosyltransferase involved in cell wall biosynthesis